MGLFDSAKDKASELAGEHQDTIDEGVEKAGDAVDEKTDGKYADKVDSAQEAAKERLGDL
ncbi:antitoxin [Flexivirga sp.]|uniref:antitoxin n=1 Tax=Flexivirga sp. TaxID=1962927 RepID=UPI003F80B974